MHAGANVLTMFQGIGNIKISGLDNARIFLAAVTAGVAQMEAQAAPIVAGTGGVSSAPTYGSNNAWNEAHDDRPGVVEAKRRNAEHEAFTLRNQQRSTMHAQIDKLLAMGKRW